MLTSFTPLTPSLCTNGQAGQPGQRLLQSHTRSRKYVTPSFGNAGIALPVTIRLVDNALGFVQGDRIREMLFEDVMGYGVLRSIMDYLRPLFFGTPVQSKTDGNTPNVETGKSKKKFQGNMPAARERMIREACSIFTDIILPGVVAHPVATRWAMIDDDTLRLFQKLGKNGNNQGTFLCNLSKAIAGYKTAIQQPIYSVLNKSLQLEKSQLSESAIQIAKLLKQNQLDIKLNGQWFHLDQLLADTHTVLKVLPHNGSPFQRALQATLKNTLAQSGLKAGVAMATGLSLTFLVPYFNAKLTEKMDKLRSYPGELGLRKPVYVSKQASDDPIPEESFSYATREFKQGNPLPFLGALLPLAVPLGFIDTVKLSTGQFKKAFLNPFKEGFSRNLVKLFKFSGSWPFTSQQQVAALYAALITSRLLNSRSDIEFRERLVDSLFLGWMVWIMGTPFLKRVFAKWSDNTSKSQLLKIVDGAKVLRSRLEIERLLPKTVQAVTLRRFIGIGGASTALSLVVLGIVEPLIAMQWSKSQAHNKYNNIASTQPLFKTAV